MRYFWPSPSMCRLDVMRANATSLTSSTANAGWAERFPGVFHVTDGLMRTGELTGPGLGACPID